MSSDNATSAHNAGTHFGLIVAAFGRQYLVETADRKLFRCVTRGKRHDLACGDHVEIVLTANDEGVIETIAPRNTLFYRADIQREKLIAANVSLVVIVTAAPHVHVELLDRCLVATENAGIPALIVLNKMDVPDAMPALDALALYRTLGYAVLPLSAQTDIAPLRPYLHHQTSVLVGQSGVGKSTIINMLIPDADARTGEISEALGAGKHTTTHARLYHIDTDHENKSDIIDSPGMQEFGLHHLSAQDLEHGFIEFKPYIGECKFNDCKHINEPGCAIAAAVATREISEARLASYRKLATQLLKKKKAY